MQYKSFKEIAKATNTEAELTKAQERCRGTSYFVVAAMNYKTDKFMYWKQITDHAIADLEHGESFLYREDLPITLDNI